MIISIDHFVLTVRSVEATLEFYERVLGMRREITAGRPASLKFGSQKINIHQTDRTFEPKARRPTAGAGDFCLVTNLGIEDVAARLTRQGVAIEIGPIPRNGARANDVDLFPRPRRQSRRDQQIRLTATLSTCVGARRAGPAP